MENTQQNIPNVRDVERFGLQRKVVANMTTESWRDIPHAAVLYEPDVTEFWQAWQKLRKTPQWEGVSINTVVLYICTMGFLAAPDMNAHLQYKHSMVSGKITRYDSVNISMPAAMPNGDMMTLNVPDCEKKNLREISDTITDLRRRLANTSLDDALFEVSFDNTIKLLKKLKIFTIAGRLLGTKIGNGPINKLKGAEKKAYMALPPTERITMHDMKQGTVLISNIGSIYRGNYNAPTLIDIIPPMVCALCIGGFLERPGIVRHADGSKTIEPRTFLPINIVMDHRALDYDGVVPFIKRLDTVFANAEQITQWLEQSPAALHNANG